jgi:hypothetical protein
MPHGRSRSDDGSHDCHRQRPDRQLAARHAAAGVSDVVATGVTCVGHEALVIQSAPAVALNPRTARSRSWRGRRP